MDHHGRRTPADWPARASTGDPAFPNGRPATSVARPATIYRTPSITVLAHVAKNVSAHDFAPGPRKPTVGFRTISAVRRPRGDVIDPKPESSTSKGHSKGDPLRARIAASTSL